MSGSDHQNLVRKVENGGGPHQIFRKGSLNGLVYTHTRAVVPLNPKRVLYLPVTNRKIDTQAGKGFRTLITTINQQHMLHSIEERRNKRKKITSK